MEKTVNTTKALDTASVIRTFTAALDTVDELANCGIVSEETALNAHNFFADAFHDVLESKSLAFIVNNCLMDGTLLEYSVHIFDTEDDCRYYLGGVMSECRIITVDEFVELTPLDWYDLNKYKTVDGVVTFHNYAD